MIGKLTGEGDVEAEGVKKIIVIFGYKQWLLSIDMKTKVVQHFENFENIKNYPWDMLNNFCFHVYAQKSLFKVENVNVFFGPHPPDHHHTLSTDIRVHRADSQKKHSK